MHCLIHRSHCFNCLLIPFFHCYLFLFQVTNGFIGYSLDLGGGGVSSLITAVSVSDREFHNITFTRKGREVQLLLDDMYSVRGVVPGNDDLIDIAVNEIYIGSDSDLRNGFTGCLYGTKIDNRDLPTSGSNEHFVATPSEGGTVRSCDTPPTETDDFFKVFDSVYVIVGVALGLLIILVVIYVLVSKSAHYCYTKRRDKLDIHSQRDPIFSPINPIAIDRNSLRQTISYRGVDEFFLQQTNSFEHLAIIETAPVQSTNEHSTNEHSTNRSPTPTTIPPASFNDSTPSPVKIDLGAVSSFSLEMIDMGNNTEPSPRDSSIPVPSSRNQSTTVTTSRERNPIPAVIPSPQKDTQSTRVTGNSPRPIPSVVVPEPGPVHSESLIDKPSNSPLRPSIPTVITRPKQVQSFNSSSLRPIPATVPEPGPVITSKHGQSNNSLNTKHVTEPISRTKPVNTDPALDPMTGMQLCEDSSSDADNSIPNEKDIGNYIMAKIHQVNEALEDNNYDEVHVFNEEGQYIPMGSIGSLYDILPVQEEEEVRIVKMEVHLNSGGNKFNQTVPSPLLSSYSPTKSLKNNPATRSKVPPKVLPKPKRRGLPSKNRHQGTEKVSIMQQLKDTTNSVWLADHEGTIL